MTECRWRPIASDNDYEAPCLEHGGYARHDDDDVCDRQRVIVLCGGASNAVEEQAAYARAMRGE